MKQTDIGDVLNEHDEYALQARGFYYGDKEEDVDTLNDYLAEGERRGAWWGALRAVSVKATLEGSAEVEWDRDIKLVDSPGHLC